MSVPNNPGIRGIAWYVRATCTQRERAALLAEALDTMSIIMDTAAALDMLQKAVSGTLPMKQLRQQAKAVGGLSADELEEASNQDDQRAFLVSTILAKVGAVGIGAGTSDSQQDHAAPPAGVDAADEASQLTTAEIEQALERRAEHANDRFDLWNELRRDVVPRSSGSQVRGGASRIR